MNFEECMKFISSYSRLGAKVTDLSRARELMERVGNPQDKLKFVHIAGTNGKGSAVEYISNALIYSGYKTGQLTSPFVTHYTDRIRIDSKEIDEASLGEICGFVAERAANREYSQFEITMAIAFLWFEREKCDIAVVETGIGGLLDSTNVIPPPLVSVITSISLDHTAILGDTLEKIAEQKAGIIKKNSVTVVSMDNCESVCEIIGKKAAEVKGVLVKPNPNDLEYLGSNGGISFIYKGKRYQTAMSGDFQMFNAVNAIEACTQLRSVWEFEIPDENISKAVSETSVQARMQYFNGDPTIVVDGGHNPDALSQLSKEMRRHKADGRKIYAVTGASETKDYRCNMAYICDFADKVYCVDDFSESCISAEKLAEAALRHTEAETSTLFIAVRKAKSLARRNNGIVVICGSLYLASMYLNNMDKI